MSDYHHYHELIEAKRDRARWKRLPALARSLPEIRHRPVDTLIPVPTPPAELLLTKREFELLIEHAIAEYHAMPQPRLRDAGDPPSRFGAKAVAERLHRHIAKTLDRLGCLGDDA